MKRLVLLLTLLSMVTLASRASVPLKLSNNSTFADGDIYVAIIGQYQYSDGAHGIYYDLASNTSGNTQVKRLTTGCNTLSKPGVSDRKFANIFTKLSNVKDKTIYLDNTFGCRIFFAFKSPMYLHVNDDNGGYAGADFGNPNDPNHGIRWELVEFTNAQNGIWINTSRVDAFQYPMGLELYGANNASVKYIKVGETKNYADIINLWKQQHGNDIYGNCLKNDITTDNLGGIILQPSKVAEVKNAGIFDNYINTIWEYYKTHTLHVKMGVLGYWEGTVNSSNVFTLTCKEGNYWNPGSVATIRKPSTVDAIEGAGAFASGDAISLTVQAMFCGAFNRGVVTTYASSTEDWSPTGTVPYFSSKDFPCNEYVKFFHQQDLTYEGRTYAFAYDDTFDQSSTCTTSVPDHVVVTIGGFANGAGEGSGSTTTPTTTPTATPSAGNGYKLVWSDEFDSNTLGKNWNVEVTDAPNNNELQSYTNRSKNVKIENGNLVLTASRENYNGRNFTSGRVNSEKKVYFTHGKVEASIKMPNLANGLWPAFWMMGNDISSVGWPKCGEIDIMEAGEVGGIKAGKQNRWAGATIHWGEDWTQHQMWSTNWQHDMGKTIAGDGKYHKWTCEWDETWLKMYLDDATEPYETFAINKSIDANITSDAYTHKPYFILFNLAVGGDFPQIFNANGVTALGADASMYVDYVRVYQKENAVNVKFAENDAVEQPVAPVIDENTQFYLYNVGAKQWIKTGGLSKDPDSPALAAEAERTANVIVKQADGTYTIADPAYLAGWGVQGRNTIYESNNGGVKTNSWGTTLTPGFTFTSTGDAEGSVYIEYTWGQWTKGNLDIADPSNKTYALYYGDWALSTTGWNDTQKAEVAGKSVYSDLTDNKAAHGDYAKWLIVPVKNGKIDVKQNPDTQFYLYNVGQNKWIKTGGLRKDPDSPALADQAERTANVIVKQADGTYTIADPEYAPAAWGVQGRNTIYESNNGSVKTNSWGTTLIPGFKFVSTGDADGSVYIEYTWGQWTKGNLNIADPSNKTYALYYGDWALGTDGWNDAQKADVAAKGVYSDLQANEAAHNADAKWLIVPVANGKVDVLPARQPEVVVPETPRSVSVTMSDNGVATYSSAYPLDFTSVLGVNAYIAAGYNSETGGILLTRVDEVPANTGLMLKGTAGTYEVPVKETKWLVLNLLEPVVTATTVAANDANYVNFYYSNSGSNGAGYYRINAPMSIGANRAYLHVPVNSEAAKARVLNLEFEDEVTGIKTVGRDSNGGETRIYDLQGRQVRPARKGFYIQNGKKIVR